MAKRERKRGKKRRSNPRLRYKRKYQRHRRLEEEAEHISRASAELGEYLVHYLDKALEALRKGLREKVRKLSRRFLRRGHASLMGVRRDKKGRSLLVDHLVVNGKGRIRHYGVHGARGWNPEQPSEVQFRNKRGEDMEWEEIGEIERRRGWREPAHTRRWKRAGKKDNPNKKRRS